MEAILAVEDLFRSGRPLAAVFPSLAVLMRRFAALDVVAVRSQRNLDPTLVYGADARERRAEVDAIVRAAVRYLEDGVPLDRYEELTEDASERWICVPLTDDDGATLGVLVVSGHVNLVDERTTAFVACVAHHVARACSLCATAAAEVERVRFEADARAIAERRDQILAEVSHDLKNPIGIILMSTEYLLGVPPVDQRQTGRSQIEVIRRNAERMRRLVADLLDNDSIAAGRMSIRATLCDPRRLLVEAVADTRPAAVAAGIELALEHAPTLPHVFTDPDRVVQVLTNLLANALKFTARGGRVALATRRDEPDRDEVTFSVADSGPGIAPDALPHVFDRYWRARPEAKNGSGLGLAICKSLVELLGGRIWAESTLGKGTAVSFTMPTRRIEA